MLAFIFPIEGNLPGPVDPGYGIPGVPGSKPPDSIGTPEHPIVIPPDAVEPGTPSHPIYLPVYPDHSLPGAPVRPAHPIVYPPGLPATPEHPIALPPTPTLPPLTPAHPIVLPPDLGVHGAVVIPLPQNKMAPPEGVPAGSRPAIIWFGPGTLPAVAWVSPVASPK